jgi:hypothetical protein
MPLARQERHAVLRLMMHLAVIQCLSLLFTNI